MNYEPLYNRCSRKVGVAALVDTEGAPEQIDGAAQLVKRRQRPLGYLRLSK